MMMMMMMTVMITYSVTVFAGVLFLHQPGVNHAPEESVTQVNHSVHTLSTFLRKPQHAHLLGLCHSRSL